METKRSNAMKAIGYIRVSTEEQAASGLGLEAQRAAIEAYAAKEGLALSAVYEDAAISGAAEVADRPGLIAALDALEEGDALVVAKIDRLGRDLLVIATAERLVERAGARLCSADGVGNGDGPEAALLRGIVASFAVYERALIRARTRVALAAARARGVKLGRPALHVEAGVLELAGEMREGGSSFRAIAAALNARGFRTALGSAYTHVQVSALLRRRA